MYILFKTLSIYLILNNSFCIANELLKSTWSFKSVKKLKQNLEHVNNNNLNDFKLKISTTHTSAPILNFKPKNSVAALASFNYDATLCPYVNCSKHGSCLSCNFNKCRFGDLITVNCTTHRNCSTQQATFQIETNCRYCWQTSESEHECDLVRNCSVDNVRLFQTTCRTAPHVICIGRRNFYKNIRCNYTSGYSWSKAMIYSITLGGFGIDRFYLGLWKSGIGKLFSFGGFGIWTIIDIILIAVGYIRPADGSAYI